MKHIIAALVLALVLIGCSKNNPVEAIDASTNQTESMFSESSMYNTTIAGTDGVLAISDSGGCVHDSLRNVHMLDSLKVYLTLTDDQFTQLQQLGSTLFNRLSEIRELVHSGSVSRDSSRTLVTLARAEFITSVKAILTTDQQALFDTWISLYWDKPKPGHGGPGGHGGPHHGGGRH